VAFSQALPCGAAIFKKGFSGTGAREGVLAFEDGYSSSSEGL